jgi:Fe-S cluster biogenesis protein NfuA
MEEKVREIIESEIKPRLAMEGGGIELIEVDNGVVKVMLSGACAGCPFSQITLANLVEAAIKKYVPEVKRVEAIEAFKTKIDNLTGEIFTLDLQLKEKIARLIRKHKFPHPSLDHKNPMEIEAYFSFTPNSQRKIYGYSIKDYLEYLLKNKLITREELKKENIPEPEELEK